MRWPMVLLLLYLEVFLIVNFIGIRKLGVNHQKSKELYKINQSNYVINLRAEKTCNTISSFLYTISYIHTYVHAYK